jgi:hypothetical protein
MFLLPGVGLDPGGELGGGGPDITLMGDRLRLEIVYNAQLSNCQFPGRRCHRLS